MLRLRSSVSASGVISELMNDLQAPFHVTQITSRHVKNKKILKNAPVDHFTSSDTLNGQNLVNLSAARLPNSFSKT
jgi:hypothetical protein